ncbi:tRNA-guanine(15) transglycosylase-like protein [Elaphomyces granulatus]
MRNTMFNVLHPAPAVFAPRVGMFVLPGRKPVHTPHYLSLTSRGAVPHLTQDVMRDHTSISSLYIALEDFIEKAPDDVPPLYKMQAEAHESTLRKFTCLPDDILLVMGPRRVPPVFTPMPNTGTAISILTSVGFRKLEAEDYIEAVRKVCPDIVVGLADLVVGLQAGIKRREKMVDRTHAYTRDATKQLYGDVGEPESESSTVYFAPVLPLENTQQMLYLDDLGDELREHISGLAVYEASSLAIVPDKIGCLPRLTLSGPKTPHEILREISLGADLITIPFVGTASDGGIALDFIFAPPLEDGSSTSKPLGIDMWSPIYAADLSPLAQGCECYTCTKHHRAYIQHLLSAKEMLAWTLLQIHNLHTIDCFFAAVRDNIEAGTFTEGFLAFEQTYQPSLPQQTGQGPRRRGYHAQASGPGEPKLNSSPYDQLDDAAEKYAEAQSSVPTPDVSAEELQISGFAVKDT